MLYRAGHRHCCATAHHHTCRNCAHGKPCGVDFARTIGKAIIAAAIILVLGMACTKGTFVSNWLEEARATHAKHLASIHADAVSQKGSQETADKKPQDPIPGETR